MSPKIPLVRVAFLLGLLTAARPIFAADAASATPASAPLAPLPAPLGIPAPAPATDSPYAPQPILPGGVVIPLFAPDSPYLKKDKVREAEVYHMGAPGEIAYIVGIHNPSIEFHPGNGSLNTGVAIILAAGGGHRTLNVGGEGADFVHFFANHGVNTVILRNRLRSDGYEPKTDGVYDAQQAIKLVRAHAKEWKLDPNKIGIMGFSAGAELAAATTLQWEEFDRKNDVPENPLAKVSSRPDFAGIIYPGPSQFARGGKPAIPRDTPPSFITSAGWGDWIHAVWATEYFTAMLYDGVPNVEMHIYARGHHPGDKVGPDEPPSTGGLTNRGFIAYGTWPERFIEWFRDLGFLGKPGVETQAAKDVATNINRTPRDPNGGPPPRPATKPADSPVPPSAPTTTSGGIQGSAVFNWTSLTAKPTANGTRREVTDLPTATLEKFESHITTLNPGAMSHPPHKHAREEFIILKEGTLDVSINGAVTRAGSGSLLFFASNDLHNVTNVGSGPATYLVFNLATAATKTAPEQGAAAAAIPGKLASSVYDWEKLVAKPTKTGARRELLNSPTITCTSLEGHVTTLNPGEIPHAAHRHPDEEIIVVKEGLMEATINGISQRAGPGSIFFYASNDEHGMKNVGTSVATYYVFRVITEATPKANKSGG